VLVVAAVLRRRIPESARFVAASGQGRLARRWSEILRPPHRQRLALVCVAAVLIAPAGDLSRTALILGLGPLAAAVLVASRFPETAGAELEAITPAASPEE